MGCGVNNHVLFTKMLVGVQMIFKLWWANLLIFHITMFISSKLYFFFESKEFFEAMRHSSSRYWLKILNFEFVLSERFIPAVYHFLQQQIRSLYVPKKSPFIKLEPFPNYNFL